jgi:serine/threonine-protein kinase RsbW/stage II sporulation protein AB (anti-sigma F factor)
MLDGLEVDVWPVAMVVSEALTNAVVHAYRDREPGHVRLAASVEGMVLTLVVADDGVGLSPRVDSPGLGVGLAIIRRLAQELEISNDCGTRLRVRLMLAPGP